MRCHIILPLCLLLASFSAVRAQSRKFVIAVIGSSTAEGVGADPIDSSWVNRTKRYFKQLGEIDTIYNIALGGQTTYDGMPTGFVPPPGRPAPDTATNVTKALSFHPDVVIVSFPTNDAAADYSLAETMSNLRAIYRSIRAAGKSCYITTSQPRSSVAVVQQDLLKQTRDSVLAEFRGHSLNFYNPIVAADSLDINPAYNFDGTHVNDAGHRQLFQVVRQANILSAFAAPLALNLVDFSAVPEGQDIVLHWTVANAFAPVSFVVQRSGDGTHFSDVWQEPAATADSDLSSMSWTDDKPLAGSSYYRLEYSPDGNGTSYSGIVEVDLTPGKFGIGRFYMARGAGSTRVEVLSPSTGTCTVTVVNTNGQYVFRQVTTLSPPWVMITLPASGWAAGEYFLRLVTDKGEIAARAFIKL
ncbi:MAG TPA: GDSL-type esterase/lipase family protein [Puia sp.]|nr:GDSL-type esterase/lipase family protein [Puia sp.]